MRTQPIKSLKTISWRRFCTSLILMRAVVFAIVVVVSFNSVFAQQPYRRHFIIAYDISTPFIKAEANCPAYTRALTNLFLNQPVSGFNEAYQDNINVEKKNGLLFFDKDRDEISFFHFNIAEDVFSDLRIAAYNGNETEIISSLSLLE